MKRFMRYVPTSLKSIGKRAIGDLFQNDGGISDLDFEQIRRGIDRIKPSVFIEIGAGAGVSTRKIVSYLTQRGQSFDFYSIEIFKRYCDSARRAIPNRNFHPVWGLSVEIEETTPPARTELKGYRGPQNVLRQLLADELSGRTVDMALIDSRKGSALPEFKVLSERLSAGGAIFCHDILNGGKGVEVHDYLCENADRYAFEVIETGPEGIIRIMKRPQ